jgi:hypothetical protein
MCNCGKNKYVKKSPLNPRANTKKSLDKLSNALSKTRGKR